MLRRAIELDVNLIDTAESYGPHVSEELIAEVAVLQNSSASVALSPDGKLLATWGSHYEKTPAGKSPGPPKEGPDPASDPNRIVQLWDATSGKELAKVQTEGFGTPRLVFSPDGQTAALSTGSYLNLHPKPLVRSNTQGRDAHRSCGNRLPQACPTPWSNGWPKPSDSGKISTSFFVQRAVAPRSRTAVAVWYGCWRVRFCRSVISGLRGRSIGRA